ncbi:TonB family protein [Erythrobacter sp. YJ-T3-07]|uniref:energy transducer TonB n=1 Tax=Erythrobacter sp. YJ-T3-07 TaxID=2793063 RepID=UPI0018D369EE|nr:energy transducer TonB [Erythrobacter sp. YJ-T3-07]MBH1944659.1 TonB family protein [Erythrobacter sp. YJ-T3-07]
MAYTYANQTQNRLPAILGVAGVHAGLGALLIYGLASGEFEKIVQPPLEGGQIELPPPPPPPKPVDQPQVETPPSARDVVAPKPPLNVSTSPPRVDTSDIILPPAPPQPLALPSTTPTLPPPPPPKPTPSFDPVAARPANNAGSWVTQSDYRSSWISRDYAGTVGFRLNVGASGRVEGCSVTQSSGVAALDEATCQLVTRRARFDPAKNGQGRAVAGSYNGAVRWQLPD